MGACCCTRPSPSVDAVVVPATVTPKSVAPVRITMSAKDAVAVYGIHAVGKSKIFKKIQRYEHEQECRQWLQDVAKEMEMTIALFESASIRFTRVLGVNSSEIGAHLESEIGRIVFRMLIYRYDPSPTASHVPNGPDEQLERVRTDLSGCSADFKPHEFFGIVFRLCQFAGDDFDEESSEDELDEEIGPDQVDSTQG